MLHHTARKKDPLSFGAGVSFNNFASEIPFLFAICFLMNGGSLSLMCLISLISGWLVLLPTSGVGAGEPSGCQADGTVSVLNEAQTLPLKKPKVHFELLRVGICIV